jgi:translation elongation factor EF-G
LLKRGGTDIRQDEDLDDNETMHLSANVPLANIASYSSVLRKLTSGNNSFTLELASYTEVSSKEYQKMLDKKNFN